MYTLRNTSAFTLIEIMIVIAMIAILMASSMIPYGYYMDRARVEKNIDAISQQWIIAHQKIRSGLLAPGTESHAHMYIDIEKGAHDIIFSTSTGGTAEKKEYTRYTLDTGMTILDMSGSIDPSVEKLTYHIAPPDAHATLLTGATLDEYTLTGLILTIGYPGASVASGRARHILLRPYFD